EGRAGGVKAIDEHAGARGVQPKLLLVLQRTHGRQRAEMVVQGGDAHARDLREIFHTKRLRVIRLDPGDRFGCTLALISLCRDGPKACAFRAAKDSVDDLALNQAAYKRNVLWGVSQIYEPAEGAEDLRRSLTGRHGRAVGRDLGDRNLLPAE